MGWFGWLLTEPANPGCRGPESTVCFTVLSSFVITILSSCNTTNERSFISVIVWEDLEGCALRKPLSFCGAGICSLFYGRLSRLATGRRALRAPSSQGGYRVLDRGGRGEDNVWVESLTLIYLC